MIQLFICTHKKSKKWKQRLEKSLNSKLQKSFPGYLYHFLQWFALFSLLNFYFSSIFFCCILYQFSIIILPHTRLASEKAWNDCIFQHRWSKHFLFSLSRMKKVKRKLNINHFILFLFIFTIQLSPVLKNFLNFHLSN